MTDYTQQVKELNPDDLPMNETDYYRWMLSGGFADSRIQCKLNYLADRFGFVKGSDSINQDCINTLNWIGTYYFNAEEVPRIKKQINT